MKLYKAILVVKTVKIQDTTEGNVDFVFLAENFDDAINKIRQLIDSNLKRIFTDVEIVEVGLGPQVLDLSRVVVEEDADAGTFFLTNG